MKKSKIETNHLELPLREMRIKGYSYSQMINEVWNRYNVKLNNGNLNRFFSKQDENNTLSVDDTRDIDGIRSQFMGDCAKLIGNTKRYFKEIGFILDSSSLPPLERKKVKTYLQDKQREIISFYIESREKELEFFHKVELNNETIDRLLIAFSNIICNKCRKPVNELINRGINIKKEKRP